MNALKISAHTAAPAGWREFVAAHPQGKLYHLPEWDTVVTRTLGRRTHYVTLHDGGELAGILPLTEFNSRIFGRFAVSQPFINYGGPLLASDELITPLERYLAGLRSEKRYRHIELRMDRPIASQLPCKQHKVTFFMDLPEDPEILMASLKAKVRSQVRRPMKENMSGRSGGLELLNEFYKVFTINMRELGTPPLPKSFFRAILEQFPQNAFIVTVYAEDGAACAGAFLIQYKDTMEIPWASALREYNRYSPNMLLYWECFRLAIEKGAKQFDFGRCTPDSGTYRFKKQWPSREQPLYWYYVLPEGERLPELNPDNAKFSLAIKTWTKLPLSVTRIVGPQIIKNIP